MSKLPEDIIAEILSRIPVKPLLRFRCVSKPWCALIDSPDFVKSHLKQSVENSTNLTVFLKGMGPLRSVEFNSLDKAVECDNPFKNFEVLGSCNGLLLLQGDHIVLLNPATRRYTDLPPTPFMYPDRPVTSIFEKFGIGYDSVTDDYKVIRVIQYNRGSNWVKSDVRICSLKLNSWRKIGDFPYCLPYKRLWGGRSAHLNGILHTVVHKNQDFQSPKVIAAFDIRVEKYHVVPQPDFWDKDFDMTVEVLGGCLCMMGAYPGNRTDIWMMKDYGVKESWTKLLSISPPMVKSHASLYPLGYSKRRDEVLLSFGDKKLVWYNLKRGTIRNAKVRGLPEVFYVDVCVGSLVPLCSCGKSDECKKQHKLEKKKSKNNKKRDEFLSKGFKLTL